MSEENNIKKDEKRIEVVELTAGELNPDPDNPRKITRKRSDELRESLEQFGDFGIVVIDEKNKIISGHQRVKESIALYGPTTKILCKRLIGYSEPELKAINIRANTHAGDWDLEKLAEWTADLNISVGLSLPQLNPEEDIKVKDMEPMHYEKYNYVMIVCRHEEDYISLTRKLGLDGKKIVICEKNKRKIQARAIWFDEFEEKYKNGQ